MRLPRRRRSRAFAAATLFACLSLSTAASAQAAVHKKACKRIHGCTVKLIAPGIPFTGGPPGPMSQYTVAVNTAPSAAAGTGAQPGTLVTNQLFGQRITCKGYAQRTPTTLAFKLLTATPLSISYVVTDTVSGTTAQGLEFCLAAPVAFRTLSGQPAAKTKLPDGTPGFVGLLPSCADVPATAPCLASVTTIPDQYSSTGVDVVMKVRVPTRTKGGDPWGGP